MWNAVILIRVLTMISVILVLSGGAVEAKKKKPVPVREPDCSIAEAVDPCPDASNGPATIGGDPENALTHGAPQAPDANIIASPASGSPNKLSAPTVPNPDLANTTPSSPPDEVDTSDWYIGTWPDVPYDIPLVDRSKMDPKYALQEVDYEGKEPVGSIVVDIDHRFLYYIERQGKAMRYGIGVGRLGFSWHGNAVIGSKRIWPHWTPTMTMRKILPNLPAGMDGGVDSPLGARALYLYQDGHDIMFRIHGTNEPWSIGERVSSGCVRMLNEDIVDLYDRTKIGTQVFVRNSRHSDAMKIGSSNTPG